MSQTNRRKLPLVVLAALAIAAGLVVAVLLLRPGESPVEPPGADPAAPEPAGERGRAARLDRPAGSQAPAQAPEAAPARPARKETLVLAAPWGSQPGEVGRNPAQESNPEGPMSLWVDAEGRLLVLDQVNMRVQVFEDGKAVRSVGLPTDTVQELVLDGKGDILAMDRLAERSVLNLDAEGKIRNEVALEGPGVPEGGGVTGMFWREDGLWVEVEHRGLVRIMDAQGNPDPNRPDLPGRISADGQFLVHAALEGPNSVVVLFRPMAAQGELQPLARIGFPLQILHIVSLDTDMLGRIYLAAHLVRFRQVDPFDAELEALLMVVLGPDGRELGRIPLKVPPLPEEQFRSIFVTPDGVIYQLLLTEEGARVYRYDL